MSPQSKHVLSLVAAGCMWRRVRVCWHGASPFISASSAEAANRNASFQSESRFILVAISLRRFTGSIMRLLPVPAIPALPVGIVVIEQLHDVVRNLVAHASLPLCGDIPFCHVGFDCQRVLPLIAPAGLILAKWL